MPEVVFFFSSKRTVELAVPSGSFRLCFGKDNGLRFEGDMRVCLDLFEEK